MTSASHAPAISLHALQRCRTTLEDFTASYLPLYGVLKNDFWRYFDILAYVSASLYELDELNEQSITAGRGGVEADFASLTARMDVLKQALREQSLLTARIEQELDCGLRYWQLERLLCTRLAVNGSVDVDDVMSCHRDKSFDYRTLHCVLQALLSRDTQHAQPAEPAELDALSRFLQLDERLVDIGDDCTDYEDDCCANSFNMLRCFIGLYGVDQGPLRLIELISSLEAEHAAALNALPERYRRVFWARHIEAASQPRSEKWVLPSRLFAIADEPAFRAQFASG